MASKVQAEILGDAEFNRKWEQEGQFQFLRKSNDPRFGEISLFKNKGNNDLIFAKEKIVTSKQQASNDIRDLKSRMALSHPNIHRLIGYSTAVQKELCSTNYLTKAYYEFPKSDLQKEINDRRQNGGNFTGDELQNIGNQSIQGLAHLHKLDISHGDVRPLNIGYNRDTRSVQILDRLQDPSPLEKLQSNNIINKKDLYVAPEVYRKLQGKDKTLKYDPAKNDLYGLGLSLLSAGNIDSVQNVYRPNGDLDQAALDAHLRTFDNKYAGSHPSLSQLVHTLLAKDESQRWHSQQYVDAFRTGQFGSSTAHFGRSEPPVNYQTETIHHVYSAPPAEVKEETQIVYNPEEPSVPQTHYVYNQAPQQSYFVSTQPTVRYVNSAPTTSYVNSAPTTGYVYSAPTETIVQAPTQVTTAGTTTVTVTRLDGSTYTYTVDEKDRENIVQEYEQHDPRGGVIGDGKMVSGHRLEALPSNVVYSQPTTVYSSQPTTVYSSAPTTYIDAPPGYTYRPSGVVVNQATPITYTQYSNSPYVQGTPVIVKSSIIDPSVEVRRGSSVPNQVQDQAIKKKYIIEGDKVIEVNDD